MEDDLRLTRRKWGASGAPSDIYEGKRPSLKVIERVTLEGDGVGWGNWLIRTIDEQWNWVGGRLSNCAGPCPYRRQ